MHSLKTARPLLASVAYFVLFAMALFSYVPSSLVVSWVPKVRMLQDNRHSVIQRLHAPVVLLGGNPRRNRNAARPFLWGIC